MASGVNVKMGVSGVQQFKQGMKESQAAVKNLDQQLKLNEQQLKLNGDAELYLQNKTALLEAQIKKQSEVVRQADQALSSMRKNGIDQSSKAFQDMQAQTYKAQTELMAMKTQLQEIGQAGEEADEGVSNANDALKQIGQGVSWQNVTAGIDKITTSLENVAKRALNAGKMITQEVLGAGSWADDLATRAKYFGMSTEDLQRAEKTANLIDTSVDTIVTAQNKLKKGIGSADEGVMGAFAELLGEGYDPRNTGWEKAFWDAGEALMDFTNAEQQEVYAQKLFGRSWHELIPLFETGKEAYDELNQSWNVVSDENIEKLTKMDDQYQKLKSEWESFERSIMATMAEALTPLMETLTGLMAKFNEYLASPEGQAMMEKLGEAISGMFEDLTNADPEKIIENLSGIFDKIQDGLNWLIEHKQDVVDALKVIVGGFALLKLGGLALNVGKIVSGFKQLGWLGGGSAEAPAAPTAAPAAGGSAGSGFLGGLINTLTLAAGADAMWRATEGQIKELNKEFGEKTAGMTPMEAADFALQHDLGITQDELKRYGEEKRNPLDIIGGAGTSDIYNKMVSGQAYDNTWMPEVSPFEQNLQHYYAEPMDRMTEVAGEMDQTISDGNQASADMTAAAEGLTVLPGEIGEAIRQVISNITIVIDDRCVGAIGERVSGGLGQKVVAMVK